MAKEEVPVYIEDRPHVKAPCYVPDECKIHLDTETCDLIGKEILNDVYDKSGSNS